MAGEQARPIISVIIPAYNAASTITGAIRSIERQSFQDYEIIIVNDGSSDSTREVCEGLGSKNSRIVLVNQDNRGAMLARRAGVRACHGRYCMFLDSDDWIRADAFEVVAEAVSRNQPDMVLYDYTSASFRDARHQSYPLRYGFTEDTSEIRRLSCAGKVNFIWSAAFKTDVFDLEEDYTKYKGMSYGEDWFQMVALIDRIDSIEYLPSCLYHYTQTMNSASRTYKQTYLRDLAWLFERVRAASLEWGEGCAEGYELGKAETYYYILVLLFNSKCAKSVIEDELVLIKGSVGDVVGVLPSLRLEKRWLYSLVFNRHTLLAKCLCAVLGAIIRMRAMVR